MSKVIIVCGLPGSGKTILADSLSRKLKTVCIHKDTIKEKLYESFNCSTMEDSKRLGKPSVDIMLCLAEEQIIKDIDVIIEAPLNFSEDYAMFKEWQLKYKVDLYSVICFIDSKERERRFKERNRNGAHHDLVKFGGDEYDYAEIPGKQIRVTTNRPVEELIEEVIAQLK